MYLEISACSRVLPFSQLSYALSLSFRCHCINPPPPRGYFHAPPPFPFVLTIPFLLSFHLPFLPRLRRAIFLLFPPYRPFFFFLTFSSSPSSSPILLPFYYHLSSRRTSETSREGEARGGGRAGDWIVSSIYTTFGFQFSFFRNGASPGHAVPPLFQKV